LVAASQAARFEPDSLVGLNQRQIEAVTHTGGPLLVVAGPGTGKTRVITQRIVYRVHDTGLSPRSLMAITFTNRAAAELRARVEVALGEGGVRTGTFHWMCSGLLRRFADRIGYRRDFALLGPRDSKDVLKRTLDQWPNRLPVGATADAISAIKNGADLVAEAAKIQMPASVLADAMENYAASLRRAGAIDLDDLMALSVRLLITRPEVRNLCNRSVSELLVDEFQDTNPVQQTLLTLLAPPDGAIVAVGDEDQAIYGWRGASTGTSHRFLQDFPGARIVPLEQSYRSTKHILRAAGSVIAHNHLRVDKSLQTHNPAGERPLCYVAHDEKDEARWIAEEIKRRREAHGLGWQEIAILYRVNAQSRALEDALVQAAIPYHVLSGHRFYDRPEVRAVAAYLRLALNWDDDGAAAFCIATARGVGEKRLQGLRDRVVAGDRPLADVLTDPHLSTGLPAATRERLEEMGRRVATVVALREKAPLTVVEAAIAAALADFDSGPDTSDPAGPAAELDELLQIFRELGPHRATLRDLVDRLSLHSQSTDRPDGIALLSLHAAKGLEFTVVFIAGLEEGLLPHRRALDTKQEIEEERRLCYVGMTRAQKVLCLSYAHLRMLGGQALTGGPSRFLAEIGPANLSTQFSPVKFSRPRLLSAKPGDRVDHTRWRVGTVTAVEGQGQSTLVTIQFDSGRKHRLQLCHAPLTRLTGEGSDVHPS
jgi:DNA helicase-2/ATP-dependent DNA helicase PcrA